MTDLKPCPRCGGTKISRYIASGRVYVYCIECYNKGRIQGMLESVWQHRPAEDVLMVEIDRLQAENERLREAIDISHAVHNRLNKDYVRLKNYILSVNLAVDKLCPKVSFACTKLTPPSISDAYKADFAFARELREFLNNVTHAQNAQYQEETNND